jgi:uncharacterized metal-binding protein
MGALKLAFWFVLTIGVVASLVSLVTLNREPINVSIFQYTSAEYQKWIVLSACVLIGAVLSSLFFITTLIVSETRNIRLRRANRLFERALAQSNPSAVRAVHASPLTQSSEPSLEEDV